MKELKPYGYVAKTGGTTGANFDAWNNGVLGDIARGFPAPRVLTPSAPGKVTPNLGTRGVPLDVFESPTRDSGHETAKLTHHAAWAEEALRAHDPLGFNVNFIAIANRFLEIVRGANLDEPKFQRLLEQYESTMQLRAGHEGLLEIIQGQIVADFIPNSLFVWPNEVVEADEYGRILMDKTKKNMREYLRQVPDDVTLVVPSHNGRTKRGNMLQLTRNCGDAVGANMSRATKLPYVIFGSTDGIASIDPTRYPGLNPKTREMLSFKELHTATQGGAYVVHVEGIRPIEQMHEGQMEIRNFQRPEEPKTMVTRDRSDERKGESPRLIAGEVGNATLVFVSRSVEADHDFAPRVAAALSDREVKVKRLTREEQRIVAIIDTEDPIKTRETLQLKKATGADSVTFGDGRGMITVVGSGFQRHPGAERRRGEALESVGIAPRHSEQTGRGSGWRYYVSPSDFEPAMEVLHKRLIEDEETA